MQLSTKGRYAVRAILELMQHEYKGPVSLTKIAERQFISLAYLEQLFKKLREHGLVKSKRGSRGGYELAKPAHTLSLGDVLLAVEEPFLRLTCQPSNCRCQSRKKFCLERLFWKQLEAQVQQFFHTILLQPSLFVKSVVESRQHE